MIGETITITYNAVTTTLNRINQDNYSSEYYARTSTFDMRLRIRHQNESARPGQKLFERHQIDLIRTEFDAVNGDKIYQAYTVIRLPKSGADPVSARHLNNALCAIETTAFVDKVIGWES